MNRLKSHTAYLAGAIDKVTASDAMEWREDMTDFLNDLGIGVFNPCDKPIYNTTVHIITKVALLFLLPAILLGAM